MAQSNTSTIGANCIINRKDFKINIQTKNYIKTGVRVANTSSRLKW